MNLSAKELLDLYKGFIRRHSLQEAPREACGIIVTTPDGQAIQRCKNIAENPEEEFEMSVKEFGYHERSALLAYYHSHPIGADLTFSEVDKWVAEALNKPSIIYFVQTDDFKIYVPKGMEIPYVGRPFVKLALDCISLVIDYYRREYNIHLKDFIHKGRENSNWDKDLKHVLEYANKTDLEEHYYDNGFKTVFDGPIKDLKKMKKGDIILMRQGRLPCSSHVGIYLGNNRVLQQLIGSLSEVSYLDPEEKLKTNCVLRHQSLW